jgi:hypothetical protein
VFGSISFFGYALPDPEHSTGARVFLVVGYAVAAWSWWRAGRKTQLAADFLLWRLGAVLLFILALNKLFNLRLLSEAGMRALAKSGHWYDHRQPVQFALAIVLPFLCAVLTSIFFARKGRAFFRRHGSALWGWVMLLFYLTLRQTQEWKPVLPWLAAIGYRDWRLVLEGAGIAFVAFSAFALRNKEQIRLDAGE